MKNSPLCVTISRRHFEKRKRQWSLNGKRIIQSRICAGSCSFCAVKTDRVQTHESIRKNLIEETYEAVEAIDCKNSDMLKEELGDVLLQVVFHAQMEAEEGRFTFDDVADGICQKLIVRHPHIFSDTKADSADEVLDNWNRIKQETKGQKTATETLNAVPRQLPALMRSEKVQSRARKAGFDYCDVQAAYAELRSEVDELNDAMLDGDLAHIAEEIGDTLFAAVNVARFYDMDPEELLTRSCDKFISRFAKVEVQAVAEQIELKQAEEETLGRLWNTAKH